MDIDKPINLFYQEPNPDRWFKYDRYPRHIVRNLIKGKPRPGGVAMVAINLIKGLDKLGIPYRLNDFKYIKKHPKEIACIIGKPHVLFERTWENPILFGAGIYSHPIDCPDLFLRLPNINKVLVPGPWIKDMYESFFPGKISAWPVGIDTELWAGNVDKEPSFDFLVYDKIRWEHDRYQTELIDPICRALDKHTLNYHFIRYGKYQPSELLEKIKNSKAVIFLCEHETQGLAYQQILATNTPILAWDRGGYWQDPSYYPAIQYGPVSSVPYWDDCCGLKFSGADEFEDRLNKFLGQINAFHPREYILENLTLEKCAEQYLTVYRQVQSELS